MIQRNEKTDRQKLAGLEHHIHENYSQCSVILEPFMMFTKGEDQYVGWRRELDKYDVETYRIHPPDMIIMFQSKLIAFELDGTIHDSKTAKTQARNDLYELNGISYVVINETDLKEKLGIFPRSKGLTQHQINEEFDKKIKKKLV
jgi:hypothetical protein